MGGDYEIETPEFLRHGIKVYQRLMLDDSEEGHVKKCLFISGYAPGSRICDMGCGIGYVADQMRMNGYDVVGVTNSPVQYDYAKRHFPDTEVLLRDMTEAGLESESFDAVQWMESIGCVDQKAAFREGARILKPMGRAIAKDFATIRNADDVSASWSYRFISSGEFVRCAEKAGLRLIRAFLLKGSSKRFDEFCLKSKLMQELHPAGTRANRSVSFWYEFMKTGEVV